MVLLRVHLSNRVVSCRVGRGSLPGTEALSRPTECLFTERSDPPSMGPFISRSLCLSGALGSEGLRGMSSLGPLLFRQPPLFYEVPFRRSYRHCKPIFFSLFFHSSSTVTIVFTGSDLFRGGGGVVFFPRTVSFINIKNFLVLLNNKIRFLTTEKMMLLLQETRSPGTPIGPYRTQTR